MSAAVAVLTIWFIALLTIGVLLGLLARRDATPRRTK